MHRTPSNSTQSVMIFMTSGLDRHAKSYKDFGFYSAVTNCMTFTYINEK